MAKELKMDKNTLIIGAGNLGSAIAYGYESFINSNKENIYIYMILIKIKKIISKKVNISYL